MATFHWAKCDSHYQRVVLPSGKLLHNKLERSSIFNGQIRSFELILWPFSSENVTVSGLSDYFSSPENSSGLLSIPYHMCPSCSRSSIHCQSGLCLWCGLDLPECPDPWPHTGSQHDLRTLELLEHLGDYTRWRWKARAPVQVCWFRGWSSIHWGL